MKTNGRIEQIATLIDALRRQARIGVVRSERGGSVPRMFSPEGPNDLGPHDQVVARVYEPGDLLDVELSGELAEVGRIVRCLVDVVEQEENERSREPRPPVSVLMHGLSEIAMSVVAHALALRLEAELVQVSASTVLPASSGGSQPIVAPAVNRARGRCASVLYLDELETLVSSDRGDIRRQRALADLMSEALRPVYGRAPVVLAGYVGAVAPPQGLTRRFDHLLYLTDVDADEAPETAHAALHRSEQSARTARPHTVAQRSPWSPAEVTDSAA